MKKTLFVIHKRSRNFDGGTRVLLTSRQRMVDLLHSEDSSMHVDSGRDRNFGPKSNSSGSRLWRENASLLLFTHTTLVPTRHRLLQIYSLKIEGCLEMDCVEGTRLE